mmetsp:Transcript_11663/g.32288  ORF Transcript_11663/g.32288 Transcript_11663/m.32288 type:complete len:468 (+) Transcript_11663:190-1593(+)
MTTTTDNPIDFALRTVESTAFAIHSVLGITEPFTGCLRVAFSDKGALPVWVWPVAGLLLAGVAVANFSGNDASVLAAQAYIAFFHLGGVLYHRKLRHHPAVGCAPAVFVVLAFIVAALRTNLWIAALGTVGCGGVAAVFVWLLVRTPDNDVEDEDDPQHQQQQQQQQSPRTNGLRQSGRRKKSNPTEKSDDDEQEPQKNHLRQSGRRKKSNPTEKSDDEQQTDGSRRSSRRSSMDVCNSHRDGKNQYSSPRSSVSKKMNRRGSTGMEVSSNSNSSNHLRSPPPPSSSSSPRNSSHKKMNRRGSTGMEVIRSSSPSKKQGRRSSVDHTTTNSNKENSNDGSTRSSSKRSSLRSSQRRTTGEEEESNQDNSSSRRGRRRKSMGDTLTDDDDQQQQQQQQWKEQESSTIIAAAATTTSRTLRTGRSLRVRKVPTPHRQGHSVQCLQETNWIVPRSSQLPHLRVFHLVPEL